MQTADVLVSTLSADRDGRGWQVLSDLTGVVLGIVIFASLIYTSL